MPPTEAEAYELLERLRWGGTPPSCPLCAAPGRCYFLRPRGPARATRTGAASARRVWKCGVCRRQFSVLSGTVLQGTRIDLRAWIAVASDWATPGPRPTVAELVDRYGLSPAAARHVTRRLERAFGDGPAALDLLLRLPQPEAARIRDSTPTRVRPRRQLGPTADYGG